MLFCSAYLHCGRKKKYLSRFTRFTPFSANKKPAEILLIHRFVAKGKTDNT